MARLGAGPAGGRRPLAGAVAAALALGGPGAGCGWRWRWPCSARPPDLLVDPALGMAAVRRGDGQVVLLEWRRDRLVRDSWLRNLGVASAAKAPAPGTGSHQGVACDELGCVVDFGGARVSLASRVEAAVEDCGRVELTIARVGPERCRDGRLIGPRALRDSGGLAVTRHGERLEVRTVAGARGDWPWSR